MANTSRYYEEVPRYSAPGGTAVSNGAVAHGGTAAARKPEKHGMPLAMAWFEYQQFCDMYPSEEAFKRGTLFPELDKPWLAAKGVR